MFFLKTSQVKIYHPGRVDPFPRLNDYFQYYGVVGLIHRKTIFVKTIGREIFNQRNYFDSLSKDFVICWACGKTSGFLQSSLLILVQVIRALPNLHRVFLIQPREEDFVIKTPGGKFLTRFVSIHLPERYF